MTRTRSERLLMVVFVLALGGTYGVTIHGAAQELHAPAWRWALAAAAAAAVVASLVPSALASGRRSQIWLSIAAVACACGVLLLLPSPALVWSAVMAGALAAVMDAPRPWQLVVAAVPTAIAVVIEARSPHGFSNALANLLACALVFGFMVARRERREADELRAAQERALSIERARAEHAAAQQAMAGQLHDVLAHTLSGLAVTLQAARVLARAHDVPSDLRAKIDLSSELASDGLREARAVVESLRAPVGPEPPLGDWLARTVDRLARGADMDIRLQGDPADVPAVRTPLARRVLTEGLTNSLRHSAGAPVEVRLSESGVRITSLGSGRELGHDSGGQGIAGLRRQAASENATLSAERTARGFELEVTWGEDPR